MNLKGWKNKAYLFIIIGGIQYIILILIATMFYAGGTKSNPGRPGYSFWSNSLSDLGRTIAYSGIHNTTSMIIFTITLTIWGSSLIPFFLAYQSFFKEEKKQKISSRLGSIFGMIAGVCLIGIAFTPADILIAPHMIFVYIGYTAILLVGISYTVAVFLNKNFPRIYFYIFLIFTIIFYVTVSIALIGLSGSETLLATGQKIGRFSTVACFAIAGYGALKR
ncbi:MAG: hypothetical protein ACTSU4_07405 [Promethearchaeota archaeon]